MIRSPFDEMIVVWIIQRKGRNGWWTLPDMVRRTRSEAIRSFKDMYVDGDKQWRRQMRSGQVRCVWAPLYYKSQ